VARASRAQPAQVGSVLHDARYVEIEGGPHGCSPRTPPTSTASRCRANGRRDAAHLPKPRAKDRKLQTIAQRRRGRKPECFPGISRSFEAFARTTENRGVPGSSPGLAIARDARWLLDFGLSGVLDAILNLGLGSPDLGLAG
jgi:hypothetical protein